MGNISERKAQNSIKDTLSFLHPSLKFYGILEALGGIKYLLSKTSKVFPQKYLKNITCPKIRPLIFVFLILQLQV